MRRRVLFLVALLLPVLLLTDVEAKKKQRRGVFGVVNGKKFSATNLQGANDPCMFGIYRPTDGILVFSALECRPKRRRQGAVRKNYKILLIGCTRFDRSINTSVFPFTLPCQASSYAENKTGRFGTPVSTTQWGANSDFTDPQNPTSAVMGRIDGFDGTTIRGVVFGTFTESLAGAGSAVPAPINGEVSFEFPVQVR